MTDPFPPGTRVRLTQAAHTRLGPDCARDPSIIGTVVGTVAGAAELRIKVRWDRPNYIETLSPTVLEKITP